jgi:hypothetical protein
MSLLETFLGSVELITSTRKESRTRISRLMLDGFAYPTPYLLRHTSDSVLTYPPASSLHFIDSRDRCARSKSPLRLAPAKFSIVSIGSRESKLTSVVAEYERLGHRLRFSASA